MRYISLFLSLIFLSLTTGCVDEAFIENKGENISGEGNPYTLSFTVAVPPMESGAPNNASRAIYYGNPVYYEDWIDTQDGLRVLFFITKREKTGSNFEQGEYDDDNLRVAVDPKNPLKDYFLFESTSRWASQLPYENDDTSLRYQITVPLYQIGDQEIEYREYWEKIRDLLRTYDFKVAILANHPASSNFKWTIQNSILGVKDIDNLKDEKNLKTINDIHHSVNDANYNSTNSSRKDAYLMLVDQKNNGAMGPYIDWVAARSSLYGDALGGDFNNRETARTWIRDYWIPDLKYNEDTDPDIEYEALYHNYRHIWSYWNFGGAASDNGLPYSNKSKINSHLSDWEKRNGSLLREYVTEGYNKGGDLTQELNTGSNSKGKFDGSLPLILYPTNSKSVITVGSNNKRFYGIKLPKLAQAPTKVSDPDCFHLKLNASGTITVRYTTTGGKLYIKRKSTQYGTTTSTTVTINGLKLTEATYYTQIDDTPEDGYIYALDGDVTIYDIEYTQDEYVYGTDREGLLPSSDHPIPMYGVQKYNKLQGFWNEGASFDLTAGGNTIEGEKYEAKRIFLLRSVAKIELLIPKSIGVPRHVYMFRFNRNVRCEPMDIATPTELLWKDHDNGCEWPLVQAHANMYNNGSYSVDSYKKKLAWFYGNWLEWGWNFNGYDSYKPDYEKDGPFPRLFNPYINRASCAAFADVTDYYNDQYYHFLLYMGENLLDSPSTYNGGGSAEVPSIRIRFDARYASTSKIKTNSDLNINGNDCYRIYMTEGGIAPGARDSNGASKIASTGYGSNYENKSEYLKYHWPILRNHVYRFTVKDVGTDQMSGLVVDAQNRTADFNFN